MVEFYVMVYAVRKWYYHCNNINHNNRSIVTEASLLQKLFAKKIVKIEY